MTTGKSDIEILLAAVPAGSVVFNFFIPVDPVNYIYRLSDKETRIMRLYLKFSKMKYGYYNRGVFKFHYKYNVGYHALVVTEGDRSLHVFHRYNTVVAAAKSDEDLDMLSTMALMVL